MQQQPMVGIRDVFFRYVFGQGQFHLIGRIVTFTDEAKSVGYSIDMRIHRECRLPESDALDHICCLPSHTGQVE